MSRRAAPRQVLAALYRFGPPRGVAMVEAAVEREAARWRWQRYVADMAYNAVQLLSAGQAGVVTFGEIEGGRPRDRRSEREIAEAVVRALAGPQEGDQDEAI